jgi:hypothetical protein
MSCRVLAASVDDGMSRGFYGAVMVGSGAGRHLIGIAGLAALAAAGALARHDRRPPPTTFFPECRALGGRRQLALHA